MTLSIKPWGLAMTSTTKYSRLLAAAGMTAALAAAALGGYLSMSHGRTPSQAAQPRAAARSAVPPTVFASNAINTVATPALAPTLPPVNSATRSAQLQALLEKGTPAAAFEAYRLLAYCDTAQTNERNARTPPPFFTPDLRKQVTDELADGSATERVSRYCGDLTAPQIAQRLVYLRKAAEAGVPGAAVQLVMQPPAGITQAELQASWDAPDVLQWREQSLGLIKLAAARADLDALLLLKSMYHEGSPLVPQPDVKVAFLYATAYDAAYVQQNGHPPGTSHRDETNSLEAAIPSNEVQQLREQGLILAQGTGK